MTFKIAFLGLGVMGYPMAGHLQRHGHQVTVFNRTSAKAEKWVAEFGGMLATSPRLAVQEADIVFACVGNDDDLRSVVLGDQGALNGMKSGSYFVDHTTASAAVARELHQQAQSSAIHFLDAPVSGGQAGAENGTLSIMIGAEPEEFAFVEPVIRAYARVAKRIGAIGSGQLCKMVNQVCIAGLLQGLAEGLHFAKQADLDCEAVLDVIAGGAAQSWQMDNRAQTMLQGQYDFGFAVDWMRKDLAIVLNEARQNGARLPVAALVDQFYSELQAMGGGRWDTSSLMALLDANSSQAK